MVSAASPTVSAKRDGVSRVIDDDRCGGRNAGFAGVV
jgi:hypothetical protein